VEDGFGRLVHVRRLMAYAYGGFWTTADTVKERAQLEEMYERGRCPWMVWDTDRCPPTGVDGNRLAPRADGKHAMSPTALLR
jgi:NDP-sugar pyrophosphorylase family protein